MCIIHIRCLGNFWVAFGGRVVRFQVEDLLHISFHRLPIYLFLRYHVFCSMTLSLGGIYPSTKRTLTSSFLLSNAMNCVSKIHWPWPCQIVALRTVVKARDHQPSLKPHLFNALCCPRCENLRHRGGLGGTWVPFAPVSKVCRVLRRFDSSLSLIIWCPNDDPALQQNWYKVGRRDHKGQFLLIVSNIPTKMVRTVVRQPNISRSSWD